jgi:hypothetical protein
LFGNLEPAGNIGGLYTISQLFDLSFLLFAQSSNATFRVEARDATVKLMK